MTDININAIIDRGIITPDELHYIMHSPGKNQPPLKILDGTFVLPGSGIDPRQEFSSEHIAGARYFDIEAISDKNSDLPHMLPPKDQFEDAISSLGIDNEDFIVVYGQGGLVMGPARVWWMFRTFGHEKICVLDGGLPLWVAQGYKTTDRAIKIERQSFEADFNDKLVRDKSQVLSASQHTKAHILDARPAPRFNGEVPEPRTGMRAGHIENSHNIPAQTLVDAQTGSLKPTEELKTLLKPYIEPDSNEIITTCGSGVTACVIALALFNCGTKYASVYDGSWSEWGRKK